MKICSDCKIEKKLNEFPKRKSSKDGLRGNCIICRKESQKIYFANYYKDNLEKIKLCKLKKPNYYNEYNKKRRLLDPLFKLSYNIRGLIGQSFRKNGYTKKSQSYKILGCTFIEFKQHLQNQFTEGMNWSNQGKWHMDHIYPVSLAKDEEELIRLNHYTNFQPLWALDNLKKGNKIV